MKERFSQTARRIGLGLADTLVTLPLLRWTWQGQSEHVFADDLPDFRPADPEAVREMMAGRYVLASKLIDTAGASPFSLDVDHPDWWNNLQSFSWLRHFRETRDAGERGFARTLVLDWITRDGQFDSDTWTLSLTAQRVINWLRHLTLLLDGASTDQARTIQRSLDMQVQCLRVRAPLASDEVEALFAAIGLLGAALCGSEGAEAVEKRVSQLDNLLAWQLDDDGLHLSRNPRLQMTLLAELASLRRAVGRQGSPVVAEFSNRVARMHEALDDLTLSSGEPVYFNGCGQVPHDVLVAVQANGPGSTRRSRVLGGYGILRDGESVVIADSGQIPAYGFDGEVHAGALGFEFSHGSELIVGSCGPAPSGLPESRALFRQSIAHSSPTIDAEDPVPRARAAPQIQLDAPQRSLLLVSEGYAERFGVEIERRITLLSDGTSLVGQDRILSRGTPTGHLGIRFHLAPGIAVRETGGPGMVRLVLPNGAAWNFLWEGARLRQDDSVRQSAYLGFNRTRQLVLEADVEAGLDVAWIFTREQQ